MKGGNRTVSRELLEVQTRITNKYKKRYERSHKSAEETKELATLAVLESAITAMPR